MPRSAREQSMSASQSAAVAATQVGQSGSYVQVLLLLLLLPFIIASHEH